MSQQGFILLLCGILTWLSSGSKGNQTCGENQWPCADGTCIFLIGRCDNLPDCPDESDEVECVSVVCQEDQRPCSSGECIDANKFCDGVIHCKDAGDELAADCQGVSISTTKKSTSVEKTTRKLRILNTTATPSTSEPVTVAPRSISTTASSPLFTSNNTLSTRMRDKTTSFEVTTTPTEEPLTGSNFLNPLTTKSTVRPTTLEAQHPPLIIIPVQKQTNSRAPTRLPTNRFQVTTTKMLNIFSLTTPLPKKTSRPSILQKTTRKYRYSINNNTYQPTTVKSPCVTTDDAFEFCRRRYRGYFRHPNDCKQYIVCEWGEMHICTCPNRTHWDLHLLTCVWKFTSPCITGQYDKPVVLLEQTTVLTTQSSATTKFLPPSLTTVTKETKFMTSTPSYEAKEYRHPPVRIRVLPATPAWLKELTERSFFRPLELPAPRYQSLLTRFFKATPSQGSDQRVKRSKNV